MLKSFSWFQMMRSGHNDLETEHWRRFADPAILSPIYGARRRFAASVEAGVGGLRGGKKIIYFYTFKKVPPMRNHRWTMVDVSKLLVDPFSNAFPSEETPLEKLRNVAIIAHVDHGCWIGRAGGEYFRVLQAS